MSLARIYSRAQQGIDAPEISIEVHLANGLPGISIVGLPEAAVRESKDRVRAAILNSQFEFPARKITISLAPADLPKEGGRFDLPIALGILAASGQIPIEGLDDIECAGELSLGGALRPFRGVLPMSLKCRDAGRQLIVPRDCAEEASIIRDVNVLAAESLLDVCKHLSGLKSLSFQTDHIVSPLPEEPKDRPDLRDVRGQPHARRAIEVAAAGGHHLLMIGPPGTGKTMLASRMAGILPPMSEEEALASASITSISHQGFRAESFLTRPFRSPHHTASGVALVGGGAHPRPGEISLAHNGILFLDELTEFDRRTLDVLREPIETGEITISRAAHQANFPARFQLIAAMNPCPQGYDCDLRDNCQCSLEQQRRHRSRISAPLMDRIDLQIEVPRLPREALQETSQPESTAVVRERVVACRNKQLERCGKANSELTNREVEQHCRLDSQASSMLETTMERFRLSARAYHRILKVARTCADLEASEKVELNHIAEAIGYRAMDRWLGR